MLKNVAITALGRYVPEQILTNFDLEKIVDTSDEWIRTRTGIQERRIASPEEKTSQLAINAAKNALSKSKVNPQEIELIVVATVSPDSNFPAVACLVQKELGAKQASAFDVSAACSGFLFALTTAKKYLETGMYKNALVIAAEKISSLIDWEDRATCVLFGDGAGACVLEAAEDADAGIKSDYMLSYGEHSDILKVVSENQRSPFNQNKSEAVKLPYVVMQGPELFKIAVVAMADAIEKALELAGLTSADLDCIVPHQANDRIISAVAKRLKFPKEKVFINIDKYGNMSAASIAVAMDEAVEQGYIKKGSTVALVTFGGGLVAASNIVKF